MLGQVKVTQRLRARDRRRGLKEQRPEPSTHGRTRVHGVSRGVVISTPLNSPGLGRRERLRLDPRHLECVSPPLPVARSPEGPPLAELPSEVRDRLSDELVDELLAGARTEEEIVGPGGLLADLTRGWGAGAVGGANRAPGL